MRYQIRSMKKNVVPNSKRQHRHLKIVALSVYAFIVRPACYSNHRLSDLSDS